MNRRRLLSWTAGAIVIAALVVWVVAGVIENPKWVRVADLEHLREAEVIYRPQLKIFVVARDRGALALSAISPRPEPKERILFCRSSGMFVSPHGELFDLQGVYFGGPAPRGMDRVAMKIQGGAVYVNPDDVTAGPARGELDPQEPTGPLCPEVSPEEPPGFVSDPR